MPVFRIILLYIGWALLWAGVQAYVLGKFGFAGQPALVDALVSNIVIVAAGYALAAVVRLYMPGLKQLLTILGWSLGLAGVSIWAVTFMLGYFLPSQPEYVAFVDRTFALRMAFAWLMVLFVISQNWIWFYIKDKQAAEARKNDTEKMAREAELFALRQQLQPHFLFNSLNSISALVSSKPEQARVMVQQLSDFLRGTLRKDDQPFVPLSDELHHLQIYLEIEKVRFGHRLQTSIDAQPESLPMQLPYLLLQPLVENALKFGLYDTLGDTLISIHARAKDAALILSIENPFDPETFQQRQGTGFGLDSVRRRLYLLYGRHDLLTTLQEGQTFTTTVIIPQKP